MKISFLITILFIFATAVFARSVKDEDAKSAFVVPDRLFAAMRAKNFEAIRAAFVTEGQLIAVDKPRDGKGISKTRMFTADTFAKCRS